ncbi:hypothetical protein PYCC9005_005679 [Savitreella phatthalungensis]
MDFGAWSSGSSVEVLTPPQEAYDQPLDKRSCLGIFGDQPSYELRMPPVQIVGTPALTSTAESPLLSPNTISGSHTSSPHQPRQQLPLARRRGFGNPMLDEQMCGWPLSAGLGINTAPMSAPMRKSVVTGLPTPRSSSDISAFGDESVTKRFRADSLDGNVVPRHWPATSPPYSTSALQPMDNDSQSYFLRPPQSVPSFDIAATEFPSFPMSVASSSSRARWTPAEDAALVALYRKYCPKAILNAPPGEIVEDEEGRRPTVPWSRIAKELGGKRSGRTCGKHFRYLYPQGLPRELPMPNLTRAIDPQQQQSGHHDRYDHRLQVQGQVHSSGFVPKQSLALHRPQEQHYAVPVSQSTDHSVHNHPFAAPVQQTVYPVGNYEHAASALADEGLPSAPPPSRVYKKGRWTPEEDSLLSRLVEPYLAHGRRPAWTRIGTMMRPPRSGLQVQARYSERLDEGVRRGRWTEREDNMLLEGVRRYGRKWHRIAGFMGGGRTQRQCLSRYLVLCKDE